MINFRFTKNTPWVTRIGLLQSLMIQKRVFLPSLTGTVSSSWAGNFLYLQFLIKEQILRSSRMGILGQHIIGLAENMRPAFGFSKSITSPERVPFQLLRECDENEGHDGINPQKQKNTTELGNIGENEEEQRTAGKYGRPGQVNFHLAILITSILSCNQTKTVNR